MRKIAVLAALMVFVSTAAGSRAVSFHENSADACCPVIVTSALKDLKSLNELRTLFRSDRGKVRVITILSPT